MCVFKNGRDSARHTRDVRSAYSEEASMARWSSRVARHGLLQWAWTAMAQSLEMNLGQILNQGLRYTSTVTGLVLQHSRLSVKPRTGCCHRATHEEHMTAKVPTDKSKTPDSER